MGYDFEQLKKIDVRDIARRLGLKPNRQSKISCFLHHGDKNPSLQLYADGWRCFGCNEGGDGLDLVAKYRHTTTAEAAAWLSEEYRVGTNREEVDKRLERVHTYPGGQLRKNIYRHSDGKKSAYWQTFNGREWEWARPKGVTPLYTSADQMPARFFLVEGEKDVDTLARLGEAAASLPDGSGSKWREEYSDTFKNRTVYIIQDNDKPGRDYAQRIAGDVAKVAASVHIIDITNAWTKAPEKADTTDLIEHLGDVDGLAALLKLAKEAPEWTPTVQNELSTSPIRAAKTAADFGEDNTRFLWYPYLPIADYSVMMADGGTGKTILCCGIAAAVSTGKHLPGDYDETAPRNVLFVSAEDGGEMLKKRLQLSGADLNRVYILDRADSIGMNFSTGYDEFEATVKAYNPALVIIDPWHAFLGESVDINRVNAIRPVFQKLANLAKVCECSLILVSHVNKRAQGENVNNAATGSSDFINASRSAVRVIFDEMDDDCRIMVHTKTNYAAYGQSVKYRIVDGGVKWEGFSDINKQTLEAAARRKATPWEIMQRTEERETVNSTLIDALESSANQFVPTRFSYERFKRDHGHLIFGGLQPKRALDAVKDRLSEDGFFLQTGIQVKQGGEKGNGFMIQRIDTATPEQVCIGT